MPDIRTMTPGVGLGRAVHRPVLRVDGLGPVDPGLLRRAAEEPLASRAAVRHDQVVRACGLALDDVDGMLRRRLPYGLPDPADVGIERTAPQGVERRPPSARRRGRADALVWRVK
jgi:hypothetical protein